VTRRKRVTWQVCNYVDVSAELYPYLIHLIYIYMYLHSMWTVNMCVNSVM
jgi:hypothetical protein